VKIIARRVAYYRGDYTVAFAELQPLANLGNQTARRYLGSMYRFGRGVPQDDKEAARWISAAAKQGHTRAETILGSLYSNGIGVVQDEQTAVKWLIRAAEKDYPEQYLLALKYAGIAQDYTQAADLFRLAA